MYVRITAHVYNVRADYEEIAGAVAEALSIPALTRAMAS
jgi:hypothetical protein